MQEKLIKIDYETIGIMEQRQLFEFTLLNKALTHEEYMQIVMIYKNVVDRLAAKLPENEGGVKMECEKCKCEELEHRVIDTKYRYSDYFQEYIKEDTVEFKCKKCGYEWKETI